MTCNCDATTIQAYIQQVADIFALIQAEIAINCPEQALSYDTDCEWNYATWTGGTYTGNTTIVYPCSLYNEETQTYDDVEQTVNYTGQTGSYVPQATKEYTCTPSETCAHINAARLLLTEGIDDSLRSKAEVVQGAAIKAITINRIRDAIKEIADNIVVNIGVSDTCYNNGDDLLEPTGSNCYNEYVCNNFGITFLTSKVADSSCDCDAGNCEGVAGDCSTRVGAGQWFSIKHFEELPVQAAKLQGHTYCFCCDCPESSSSSSSSSSDSSSSSSSSSSFSDSSSYSDSSSSSSSSVDCLCADVQTLSNVTIDNLASVECTTVNNKYFEVSLDASLYIDATSFCTSAECAFIYTSDLGFTEGLQINPGETYGPIPLGCGDDQYFGDTSRSGGTPEEQASNITIQYYMNSAILEFVTACNCSGDSPCTYLNYYNQCSTIYDDPENPGTSHEDWDLSTSQSITLNLTTSNTSISGHIVTIPSEVDCTSGALYPGFYVYLDSSSIKATATCSGCNNIGACGSITATNLVFDSSDYDNEMGGTGFVGNALYVTALDIYVDNGGGEEYFTTVYPDQFYMFSGQYFYINGCCENIVRIRAFYDFGVIVDSGFGSEQCTPSTNPFYSLEKWNQEIDLTINLSSIPC